jgi:hypothetical protein
MKIILIILIASLTICIPLQIHAALISEDQAVAVAENWIDFIIEKKGDWGGFKAAKTTEILEFKRADRLLGYFCTVSPKGFIVISLLQELTPVKAYSATCNLDPFTDVGMTDLLKSCMERLLNQIEDQVGPLETANQDDITNLLGTSNYRAWMEIEQGLDMDYQEGDTLLSSNWHQGEPYNLFCPPPPTGDDCTDPRCLVGCVATAGAQLMRYWYWPPYGTSGSWADPYDWPNMPDIVTISSPQAQIDAVAELCHEVGVGVGMDYCGGEGCQSSAYTYGMEYVYETWYRYSTACMRVNRYMFSQVGWFSTIQNEHNLNRPIQYRVVGHSIVCDGWREIGSTPIRQYHMNYGWANNATTWYTLDSLIYGNLTEEYMLINIYPIEAMGNGFSGTYSTSTFPYRYFDRDALGSYATFESGQFLQFLPGITITCAPGSNNSVRFMGSPVLNIRMYTRGDVSKGARLYEGSIKLYANGCISLH